MNGNRRWMWLAGLALALSAAGCAMVGTMPKEQGDQARNLTPPEGKALVYVVRPARIGMGVPMTVTCDSVEVGRTGGARFVYAVLDTGAHVFASKAENRSELPIVLEAGKTYYLEQKVTMGLLYARNKLVRLEEKEGREKLLKCYLSNDNSATPRAPEK